MEFRQWRFLRQKLKKSCTGPQKCTRIQLSLTRRNMPNPSICIRFGHGVNEIVRSRMDYAFRVFSAIYGYRVVAGDEGADFNCTYGLNDRDDGRERTLGIPARYRRRPAGAPAPALQKAQYAGEELCLVHGINERTGRPDWLGEIFEWLSARLERAGAKRDGIGRIAYSSTIFSCQSLSKGAV